MYFDLARGCIVGWWTLFQIEDLWLRGQYDPEADVNSPVGAGLGPACLSVTNSQVSGLGAASRPLAHSTG